MHHFDLISHDADLSITQSAKGSPAKITEIRTIKVVIA